MGKQRHLFTFLLIAIVYALTSCQKPTDPPRVGVDQIIISGEASGIFAIEESGDRSWTEYVMSGVRGSTIDSAGRIVYSGSSPHLYRMNDITGSGLTSYSPSPSTFFSNTPWDISFDQIGRILVCEYQGSIVRMDDFAGSGWVSYGSTGSGTGNFLEPRSACVDSSNRIYIADSANNRIVRIDDMNDTNWTEFGSSGSGINGFATPSGIAIDSTNRIYIADTNNNRIVRIDNMSGDGWTTLGGPSPSTAGGIGVFYEPWDIAIGPDNRIFVTDSFNDRIVSFDDMTGADWYEYAVPGTISSFDDPTRISLSYYYF